MKTPLFGPDGEAIGIQAIFWDVTERMRAEERLKEQNVTLQELAASERRPTRRSRPRRAGWCRPRSSPAWASSSPAWRTRSTTRWRSSATTSPCSSATCSTWSPWSGSTGRPGAGRRRRTRAALDAPIAELCEQLDLDYCLENLPRIIDRTREGLRRIERIVKDLRLFARVDEGEWNEVDLNPASSRR